MGLPLRRPRTERSVCPRQTMAHVPMAPGSGRRSSATFRSRIFGRICDIFREETAARNGRIPRRHRRPIVQLDGRPRPSRSWIRSAGSSH